MQVIDPVTLSQNPQIFDAFGKRHLKYSAQPTHLFTGLVPQYSEQLEKEFVSESVKIMKGNYLDVNAVKYNSLLSALVNNASKSGTMYTITSMIIKVFETVFNDFATEFQTKLFKMGDENTINVAEVLTSYQKLYNNAKVFKGCLEFFERHLYTDSNVQDKFSFVLLIKNYVFYKMVLDRTYMYKNKQVYFYDVMSDLMNNGMEMSHIIAFYKIYQFYTKFSFAVKQDREKFFNKELDSKFLLKNSNMTQKLINNVLNTINDTIKTIISGKSNNQLNKHIADVRDMIKLGLNTGDKTMFMLMYRNYLTNRIITNNTNGDVERELLNSFNYKDDPELYSKMWHQIQDMKLSKQHTEFFRALQITITSDKNKNTNVKQLERDKYSFTVMKSHAWDNTTAHQTMIVPENYSVYYDIFNSYYSDRYQDRKASFNHDGSTAVINMTLQGKVYTIHLTMPQLFVITIINNNGLISAADIANKLGVPLKVLGTILNSLIKIKLVLREDGQANNPNLKFYINENCVLPGTEISLVALMRKQETNVPVTESVKSISDNVEKKSELQLQPKNDSELRMAVLSLLVNNKTGDVNALMTDLKTHHKLDVSKEQLDEVLNMYVNSKKLTLNDGKYTYLFMTSSMLDDIDD